MKTTWALQDAKNCFSKVIRHAIQDGPQTITRRGKDTAVLMSTSMFKSLCIGKQDLVTFFHESPLNGEELDLSRARDTGREVSL